MYIISLFYIPKKHVYTLALPALSTCMFPRPQTTVSSVVWDSLSITAHCVTSMMMRTNSSFIVSLVEYAGMYKCTLYCHFLSYMSVVLLSLVRNIRWQLSMVTFTLCYSFRVGGRENFFHCEKCDICLSFNIKDSHKVFILSSYNAALFC